MIPIVIGAIDTVTKELVQEQRTSGKCQNYHIIDNSPNMEKNPGDLRRLAVTHSSVNEHQLTLLLKTHKEQ